MTATIIFISHKIFSPDILSSLKVPFAMFAATRGGVLKEVLGLEDVLLKDTF